MIQYKHFSNLALYYSKTYKYESLFDLLKYSSIRLNNDDIKLLKININKDLNYNKNLIKKNIRNNVILNDINSFLNMYEYEFKIKFIKSILNN